ncbi:HAD family hydrolase [Roseobacteraceae bacterium S113]
MSIQAVVFDIGWVLIEWKPEAIYDELIGPERRRALFDNVSMFEANLSVDLGTPLPVAFAKLAEDNPDYAEEIALWPQHWDAFITPQIDRSVRLLRALRAKGVPVFALTNFGDDTFDRAQAIYPFFTEFDRRYVSGRLKLAKPDPAIYAVVERDSGIAPEGLLFADDSPANIAAAEARGWQTHLFEGPEGWAERLVAEGLLTPEEAA